MLRLFLSLVVVLGLGAGSAAAAAWNKLVTPAQLSALIGAGGVTVLDIRSPKAYAAGHVAGALNAPYGSHTIFQVVSRTLPGDDKGPSRAGALIKLNFSLGSGIRVACSRRMSGLSRMAGTARWTSPSWLTTGC